MALFDNLRKSFTEVSDSVAKNFSEVSDTVAKKSGTVLEIQKSKLKNVSLKSDLEDMYAEIGQLYFETCKDEDLAPEMAELFEKVKACKIAIEDEAKKINDLKGVVVCPGCGAEVELEAAFCSKCGTAIPKPVVEEPEEEEEAAIEEEAPAEEAPAPVKPAKIPPRCSEMKGDGFRKYKSRLQK